MTFGGFSQEGLAFLTKLGSTGYYEMRRGRRLCADDRWTTRLEAPR